MSFTNSPLNYPSNSNTPIRRVRYDHDPTASEIKNFIWGDEWMNSVTGDWWKIAQKPGGGLEWQLLSSNNQGLETLTGNSGVATASGNNINVLGSGASISTLGAGDDLSVFVSGRTNHAVQVGSSTGDLTNLAVGASGTVLCGQTGADPVFSNNVQAPGTFTFSSITTANNRSLVVTNSGVGSSSLASIVVSTTSSTGGDAYLQFSGFTGNIFMGLDVSDSNAFKMSAGSLFGSTFMRVSPTLKINYPLQPAFLAIKTSNTTNATGNGATFQVIYDSIIFNQDTDYNNSTGLFVAPVTGGYQFNTVILIVNNTISNELHLTFNTSNRLYTVVTSRTASGANFGSAISALCDMDALDTCGVAVSVLGEAADTDTVFGTPTNYSTGFGGWLAF